MEVFSPFSSFRTFAVQNYYSLIKQFPGSACPPDGDTRVRWAWSRGYGQTWFIGTDVRWAWLRINEASSPKVWSVFSTVLCRFGQFLFLVMFLLFFFPPPPPLTYSASPLPRRSFLFPPSSLPPPPLSSPSFSFLLPPFRTPPKWFRLIRML